MGYKIPIIGLGTYVSIGMKEVRTDERPVFISRGYVLTGGEGKREWKVFLTDPDSKWAHQVLTLDFAEMTAIENVLVDGIPCSSKLERKMREEILSLYRVGYIKEIPRTKIIDDIKAEKMKKAAIIVGCKI